MPNLVQRAASPAPKWFRKTKRAVSILSNTVIVFLLARGYADNSLVMLVSKIGISSVMQAIEALLVDSDDDLIEIPLQS